MSTELNTELSIALRTAALPVLWLALLASPARADVHRHVDPASGMEVLSNVAPQTPPVAAAPAGVARAAPAVTGFPVLARERQRELDAGRRAILEDELLNEKRRCSKRAHCAPPLRCCTATA
ncbi:hypothetical protein [Duganella sp. P38]|uniref:hypothetical protein n=1 Tax=Duganella sp. P38 TaxID=3423949 RepID=UPI003D7AC6FC